MGERGEWLSSSWLACAAAAFPVEAVASVVSEEWADCRGAVGWGAAGVGVILVLASFLVPSALLFMFGAVTMAVGASSTRNFEDKKEKLTKKRKRISI